MKQLRGKRALITGAANGIGRAFARQLAAEGTNLVLVDVDADGLTAVAGECLAKGVTVHQLVCDLTDEAAVTRMTTAALAIHGGVDLLINNAGIAFYGPTETMSAAQWDRLLRINLLAAIQITREILPSFFDRDEAHILNVCSISGLVAGGRFAAYHVSKYGLVGFTEALRAEYVRRGIGVTALCPGPVTTNLYNAAESGRPDKKVPTPPEWVCATPEAVAKKGIRAIKKNHAMTLVTPMAHVLWRIKRWAPGFLDLLNRLSRRKKKSQPASPQKSSSAGESARKKAA
ncbi:MAG: SDR family NAD(P)-dependent oxidoreductase [Pirellulales bacterium]